MARTNEAKWKRIVASVKAGTKGGPAGVWSARKAQLAGKRYRESGGKYTGSKTKEQESLSKWTKQKWKTKSGKPSKETGERYLPEKAIKALSSKEYAATSKAKREGKARGQKVVPQPKKIAKKTASYRK